MPVTTRLLQRLQESLGDEATNDLFAWWEEAASVNRAAVREVADLYYARFDARLEKGLAEVRSEMAELRSDIDKDLAGLRSDMDRGFVQVRSEMATGLANQRAELLRWMFVFWAGTMLPLAGLMVALIKL